MELQRVNDEIACKLVSWIHDSEHFRKIRPEKFLRKRVKVGEEYFFAFIKLEKKNVQISA